MHCIVKRTKITLTPEEAFLWDLARHWRNPVDVNLAPDLDWRRIAEVGVQNRMAPLLCCVHRQTGLLARFPEAARESIETSAQVYRARADRYRPFLAEYLKRADRQGVPTVVLKGLAISINVYGDAGMRPGGDIDLLVRKDQVQDSIDTLEGMGIDAYWPNLMDDRFYARHHLHQQRSSEDLKTWFEIHWALDHPYTLLTIDYDALMARTTPGALLGAPVREPTLPDLLLTLVVHLVKHANYLPGMQGHPNLGRIILADGLLMYFLDVAEAIKANQQKIDWDRLIETAEETRTESMFASVFQAITVLLEAPIPEEVIRKLSPGRVNRLSRWLMGLVVRQKLAHYQGIPRHPLWRMILDPNGAFILRPVRMFETIAYVFPPSDYLRRKYGRDDLWSRAAHAIKGIGQLIRFGVDMLYFAWERYWRLRRMGFSTSLSNKVEID